ncbi:hypothetical protein F7R01_23630 [Pseudomonas argentinensis]|uniref:Uncharacterized protein n=1 Tax=Phytopseudomonas argentinensis TaxID=289370 RepID=A0A1I3QFZ9_9GAMM|nr:hypothetical protein [Pseudomonas argentinensis]KAB0545947.1 hypothetical protein F7R01_23630 [Pseudomonas argentinensis]SFJ32251.1 hypothetical protein SAMN05216602_4745 [Pseudomonas argentinensis]
MSLADLTAQGLTAHLQKVVLDIIVDEQMAKFEETLPERLETHVKAITLGHIEHIRNHLKLADEMTFRIEVNMEEVQP